MILFLFLLTLSATFLEPCLSRSLRQKRGIMKMMMHVMWDPVRLIRYWYAYDVSKEIAKSWRKIIPTLMVLPLNPDAAKTPGLAKYVHPTYGLKEANRKYIYPATQAFQYSDTIALDDSFSMHNSNPGKHASMVAVPLVYQKFIRSDRLSTNPSSRDAENIPSIHWQGVVDGSGETAGNQPDESSPGRYLHQMVVPVEMQVPSQVESHLVPNPTNSKVAFPSSLHSSVETPYNKKATSPEVDNGHQEYLSHYFDANKAHQMYQGFPSNKGSDQQSHPMNQEGHRNHHVHAKLTNQEYNQERQRYPLSTDNDQSRNTYFNHQKLNQGQPDRQIYPTHQEVVQNHHSHSKHTANQEESQRHVYLRQPIQGTNLDFTRLLSQAVQDDGREIHIVLHPVPITDTQPPIHPSNKTANYLKEFNSLLRNAPFSFGQPISDVKSDNSERNCSSNCSKDVFQEEAGESSVEKHSSESHKSSNQKVTWILQNSAENSSHSDHIAEDSNIKSFSFNNDFSINMIELKEALKHGTPVLVPFNTKKTTLGQYGSKDEHNSEESTKQHFSKPVSSTDGFSPSTQKLVLFMANKSQS